MMAKETVCVTGGSGFIGSWLVKMLLHRGYTVHATVEDLMDEKETKHLLALEGADLRLKLFRMDLLNYDSVAAAISGTVGVFHLASPNIIDRVQHPQKELLEPAIKGTENVLAAAKLLGVRRVVVTSSTTAIRPNPHWSADQARLIGLAKLAWDMGPSTSGAQLIYAAPSFILAKGLLNVRTGAAADSLSGEDCWTDIDYCIHKELWYPMSKTMAEKSAWRFAEDSGLNVVTVNPGMVIGPILPPVMNTSMAVLLRLLQGSTDALEDLYMGCVHVKDVALSHIMVYENPSASGRHLCVESISHFSDFAAKVSELYPEYRVPKFPKDTQPGLMRTKNASKKLIDMGLGFISMEQMIKDSMESLRNSGYLS